MYTNSYCNKCSCSSFSQASFHIVTVESLQSLKKKRKFIAECIENVWKLLVSLNMNQNITKL